MKLSFATALLPLRHYADFRGRSRRTELVLFYLLLSFASLIVHLVVGFETALWMMSGLGLAMFLPTFALMVRRVHDVGWSGWWLVPLLPLAPFNWWRDIQWLRDPLHPPVDLPLWADIGLGVYLLAMMVLLLWDDEQGDNRYGPNPRLTA